MSKKRADRPTDPATPKVDRRNFLKGAATGAAALAVSRSAEAQSPSAYNASLSAPSYQQIQRDTGSLAPPTPDRTVVRPGSDLMVQALRALTRINPFSALGEICRQRVHTLH